MIPDMKTVESLVEIITHEVLAAMVDLSTRDATDAEWNDWRWQYRNRVKDLQTLARLLPYGRAELDQLTLVENQLHIGIPPYYLSLIDPTDPEDLALRLRESQCFECHVPNNNRSTGIDEANASGSGQSQWRSLHATDPCGVSGCGDSRSSWKGQGLRRNP